MKDHVLIVGGGPAGMMAGLLFARAGLRTIVFEKHADFFRDFRGDTVHPSTMEALADIGLLERFLLRPHNRIYGAQISIAGRDYSIGNFAKLKSPTPFIAMMPQWDFLDFLRDEAEAFPHFQLEMNASVSGLIKENGRVAGICLEDGRQFPSAKLVLMADGRRSLVRKEGLLPVTQLGAPMDVLWFRLPRTENPGERLRGSIAAGRMVILIDRESYWQAAMLVPKGGAEAAKARGVDWLLQQVREAYPDLSFEGPGKPSSVDDFFVLNVALDRMERWFCPGLLAIGDAAHAMSPIGGIGINLAIQDAIAAANILTEPLARGEPVDPLLQKVQRRRMLPTRIIQFGQKLAQDNIISSILSGEQITGAPLAVRLLDRFAMLRSIPGKIIGHGVRRERVRSFAARLPVQNRQE